MGMKRNRGKTRTKKHSVDIRRASDWAFEMIGNNLVSVKFPDGSKITLDEDVNTKTNEYHSYMKEQQFRHSAAQFPKKENGIIMQNAIQAAFWDIILLTTKEGYSGYLKAPFAIKMQAVNHHIHLCLYVIKSELEKSEGLAQTFLDGLSDNQASYPADQVDAAREAFNDIFNPAPTDISFAEIIRNT